MARISSFVQLNRGAVAATALCSGFTALWIGDEPAIDEMRSSTGVLNVRREGLVNSCADSTARLAMVGRTILEDKRGVCRVMRG